MKLADLKRLGAFQYIELVQTFFHALLYIKQRVIRFDNAGAYLNERIFAQERINDRLPYIGGFCLGKIIIRLVDLVGLLLNTVAGALIRAGEIAADVIQKIGRAIRLTGEPMHTGTMPHSCTLVARAAETSATENSSPSK